MIIKTAVAKVTSKGRATTPVAIRRHLGINAGDRIEFTVREDGCVRVRRARYPTLASLAGAAGTLKKPKTWEEIEEYVREERAEAIVRELRG